MSCILLHEATPATTNTILIFTVAGATSFAYVIIIITGAEASSVTWKHDVPVHDIQQSVEEQGQQ